MTQPKQQPPSSVWKVVDMVIRISMPVLYVSFGWAAATLTDHDGRIRVLEATRYTRAEALSDRQAIILQIQRGQETIRNQINSLKSPPPLFEKRVDKIDERLQALQKGQADIDRRLARLEK